MIEAAAQDYEVLPQVKQGKRTGLWFVQFYHPFRARLTNTVTAKGGFRSKQEALDWVQAVRRLA